MTSTIRLYTLDLFEAFIPKKYLYGFEFETPTLTPYFVEGAGDYAFIDDEVLFKIIDDYSNFIYERIKNSRSSRKTKERYLGILRNNLGFRLLLKYIFKTLGKDEIIASFSDIRERYFRNKKIEFKNSTI